MAFSIDDKGYVGTGFDGNDLKDFWEYDPLSDVWTQKVSVGGSKRLNAFGFVIDGLGYIGGGKHNGVFEKDFWAYDPLTDSWVEKRHLDDDTWGDPQVLRENTVSFSIEGKGYISTGAHGALLSSTWEYDPQGDYWEEKTAFEGTSREEAVGFVINNVGYITTGKNVSLRLDDIWQFEPLEPYDEED